jgi:hypothetical protein
MTDWYFAGMFDEAFWAVVGKQKLKGLTAAEVLRPLVAAAGEQDLSWMWNAHLLDALCRLELSFTIKRRGEQIQWVLGPFRNPTEGNGIAATIGEAIDALIKSARIRHGMQWALTGASLP